MDKHQAEGIANAMLMRDGTSKDKHRRLYGWQKASIKARLLILVCAILGAAISVSLRYLITPGTLANAGTTLVAELGACVGFILGFCIVSLRHYANMRSRKRSTQQRLSELLHGTSEQHL